MTGSFFDFWVCKMTQQKMHFHSIPKRIRFIAVGAVAENLITIWWLGAILLKGPIYMCQNRMLKTIESWKKKMTLTCIWCCNQEKEYEIPPKKQFVPTMIFAVKDFFFCLSHNGLLKVLKNYMCSGWKSLVLLQMLLLDFYALFSFLQIHILYFHGDS